MGDKVRWIWKVSVALELCGKLLASSLFWGVFL